MRKVFKFIKVTIVTLLLLLVLLAVGVYVYFNYFFDLNQYKPLIEKIVREQTGRELSIDGEAKLGISLIPTLELEDVKFANAAWADEPYMLTLDRLDVQISVLPLLRKEIEIYRVILNKPEIYLEINEAGTANWEFDVSKSAMLGYKTYAAAESLVMTSDAVVSNASGLNLPISGFMAKNILIDNGFVKFNNKQSASVMEIKINEVSLSSKSMDDDINIGFDLAFNGEDIVGKAKVGSFKSLLEAYNPYPVILNVKAYNVTAEVDGSVVDALGKDIHYVMNVDVTNPRGNFGAPNVNFKGVVDGNLKVVKVDIQSLNVEDNIVSGQVSANIGGKVPYVDAALLSEKLNLMTMMPSQQTSFILPTLISQAQASELVPDTAIPYEFLLMANADLKLDIGEFIVNEDITLESVKLTAKLKDGVLNLNPVEINVGGGRIDMNAAMNANAQSISAHIESEDIIIQEVYKALNTQDNSKFAIKNGGKTKLDINLVTNGKTAKTAVNNLKGQAVVIVGESLINAGEFDLLSGNVFGQIFDMLKLDKGPRVSSTMNCAVVRVDFADGKAKLPNGVAFDTDNLKISVDGDINLINDKLNLTVRPFSGKVSNLNIGQAVASFMKVTGTLQNPKVGLDETAAARAVIGIAVNAPIYAASKVVMDSAGAPCYSALANTEYSDIFPKPTGVAATGQNVVNGVGDAALNSAKAVGEGVRDSAKAVGNTVKDTRDNARQQLKNTTDGIKKELDSAKDLLNMFNRK